jgi:hypothetical protein
MADGLPDGSMARPTVLVVDSNRFAPAAGVSDEEYQRRPAESGSGSRSQGAVFPRRHHYERAVRRRRGRKASASAPGASEPEAPPVEFVLCACTRASAGHGCTGVCQEGSPFCGACRDCAGGEYACACCQSAAPSDDPVAASTAEVAASPRWIWDHCAGSLTFTIERLTQHPGLCSFAADVVPPHVALAYIAEDRPDLLSRIVYVQVPADHIPT